MSDIQLSDTIKQEPKYRIKSYTMVVVLIAIIIGFLLAVGRFGPDFFAILIFFVIMLIPVILLLRNKLVNILPTIISDNLLEIDHTEEKQYAVKFNPSRYTKQVGMYIMIVILLIGSLFFLKKSKDGLKDDKGGKKIIYKILGGLVCTTIAGVILLEIDYV
jgi:hypothetical protein